MRTCPYCRSTNLRKARWRDRLVKDPTTFIDVLFHWALIAVIVLKYKTSYVCNACGQAHCKLKLLDSL